MLYFVARETVHMRQFAGQSISSITAIELEDLFDLKTIISDAIKSVPSWIAIFTWNFPIILARFGKTQHMRLFVL